MQLKEFAKYINPSTLDVVTVKGKKYRVYNINPIYTIADAIKSIRSLSDKELVYFIYDQAKNGIPIETIFDKLKLVS
ncbi:MAG: hypothetical protein E6916_07260 [Clostridium cochlearium]|uniref:Uncharacterized protein n=1 Tax=Clostridium cochlearium TaxID=1494 RepID=A0A2X2WET4_CLOCO|nr:hypothetical protein [Clostridium cochlearium]MDU1443295.1 hypothetical protein [Clostridium cochlearium]SQB36063.1 Uncharacterised protein [Clostridium cochlearium]